MNETSLPVIVENPKRILNWRLDAERVTLGKRFYKPSMALLPDGELIVVALSGTEKLGGGKFHSRNFLWRSANGGRTWSEPREVPELYGREQWLTATSDGLLFSTGKLAPTDVRNEEGVQHSYVHRSVDGGRSWERQRVRIQGVKPDARVLPKRNIVELPGGTLFFGAGVQRMQPGLDSWVLTSTDRGKTWGQGPKVRIGKYRGEPYDNVDAFYTEDFTFLTDSGALRHFVRCGPPSPMYPMRDERPVPQTNDSGDRTLMCVSKDRGESWSDLVDWGDYGQMYPRVVRLRSGRYLATFTQRGAVYPLGLRAVLSEDGEGSRWSFDTDRIILDGQTPWGAISGGGYGNTVELADGTLVSCYSTRGEMATAFSDPHQAESIYSEIVRWRLQ